MCSAALTAHLDSSRLLWPKEIISALRALRETSILFRRLIVKNEVR